MKQKLLYLFVLLLLPMMALAEGEGSIKVTVKNSKNTNTSAWVDRWDYKGSPQAKMVLWSGVDMKRMAALVGKYSDNNDDYSAKIYSNQPGTVLFFTIPGDYVITGISAKIKRTDLSGNLSGNFSINGDISININGNSYSIPKTDVSEHAINVQNINSNKCQINLATTATYDYVDLKDLTINYRKREFVSDTRGVSDEYVLFGNYAERKNGTTPATDVRIPAIINAPSNMLTVFCDERDTYVGGDLGYDGHIQIKQISTHDGGRTWDGSTYAVKASGDKVSGNFNYAHGDAAAVADWSEGDILIMCASGIQGTNGSTRNGEHIRIGNFHGKLNTGLSTYIDWFNADKTPVGKDLTDQIYGKLQGVNWAFFTSGRICQSRIIKKGTRYRIYAALATSRAEGTYGVDVMYSDDFGDTWEVLSGGGYNGTATLINSNVNETSVAELPNGDLLIACRVQGSATRMLTTYKYSDNTFTSGAWQTAVTANITAATCNGELLVCRTSNPNKYVVLLSAPMSTERKNLGIYYKIFDITQDSYTSPSFYQSGWSSYKVVADGVTSAYSSMIEDQDGNIAIVYEVNNVAVGGYSQSYDIAFKTIKLSEITNGAATAKIYKDFETGKVYMLKATTPAKKVSEGGTVFETKDWYIRGKRSDDSFMLETVPADEVTSPSDELYWVLSKGPNYPQNPDDAYLYFGNSQNDYYYFSSFVGDGYMARTDGWAYSEASPEPVLVHNQAGFTNDYHNEIRFDGFKRGLSDEKVGMCFYRLNDGATSYADRNIVVCVSSEGKVNWIRTSSGSHGDLGWSTEFEFIEVEHVNTNSYGTMANPTYHGFEVTMTRSDDDMGFDYTDKEDRSKDDYDYYATLKLPFAVHIPEGISVYYAAPFTEVHETVNLVEYTMTDRVLPRETAVLLKMAHNGNDADITKKIYLEPVPAQDIYFGAGVNNIFKGTLGAEKLSDEVTNYVLGKKDGRVAFYRYANTKPLGHNKAYIEMTGPASAAKGLTLNFGNPLSDGIKQIATNSLSGTDEVFDMLGRKVNKPQKGLYIVNGKKVLIK